MSPEIQVWAPKIEDGPIEYFKKSIAFTENYYKDEIDRIMSIEFEEVGPDDFFKECIWVIHATGFSAKAVTKFIGKLMDSYGGFDTLSKEKVEDVVSRVRKICNNPQKIKAIWKISGIMYETISKHGIEYFKESIDSPEKLAKLPYIGKVTCYHLARNIGMLDCVKPDLHLVRMAKFWGYKDCVEMCTAMKEKAKCEYPLGIVDLALWYTASTFGTLEIKKDGER